MNFEDLSFLADDGPPGITAGLTSLLGDDFLILGGAKSILVLFNDTRLKLTLVLGLTFFSIFSIFSFHSFTSLLFLVSVFLAALKVSVKVALFGSFNDDFIAENMFFISS